MEPAAILIAAFQIHVRRPRQMVRLSKHGQVTRAGIEPDIENVSLFAKRRPAAFRALRARSGQLLCALRIPDVGGLLADQSDDAIEDLAVGQRLSAALAIEHDDGHAPRALTGYAPVRPGRDHVGDALLAPGRRPLYLLDGLERALAQIVAIHADEPLFRRAKDGRIVAAPAMRIAVIDLALSQERSGVFQ